MEPILPTRRANVDQSTLRTFALVGCLPVYRLLFMSTLCVVTALLVFLHGASAQDGKTCSAMLPVCTAALTSFPASTYTGIETGANNYGCLGSQPNPAWRYLVVETPGRIETLLSSSGQIDFAMWGLSAASSKHAPRAAHCQHRRTAATRRRPQRRQS